MPLGVLNSNTVQLSALEPLILQTAEEIKGLKESQDMLKKNHNSLVEQSNVLLLGKEIYQTQTSFAHVPKPTNELDRMASVELMSLSEFGEGTSSMLGQVAGMINREHTASLERVDPRRAPRSSPTAIERMTSGKRIPATPRATRTPTRSGPAPRTRRSPPARSAPARRWRSSRTACRTSRTARRPARLSGSR